MTKFEKLTVLRILFAIFSLFSLSILSSCGGEDEEPVTPPPPAPEEEKITIDLSTTYQEMVGFGGALTWYSDRVISSSKKTEIADLIFNDLGTDIVRLKTWYYPDNYPTATSTTSMSDDNSKAMWDVTNQLHELAKAKNSNIKILLSSWGPPAGLKSNNNTRQGTLKKDGSNFMYDAYATYWENTLNNLPFNPEYISIQNEPTYTNPGWTTCRWGVTESADYPSYITAFDKVYEKIQSRTNRPIMIGPESQDITTFGAFAEALKNKPHAGMLAYHPYNVNGSTAASQIESGLKSIGSFNTKPNILTEFSDNLGWFNTALFIHKTLVHANSSGYIYWKLVWAQPASGEDAGLVSINASGNYTLTPFYYVLKHYAKHIDAGYKRVAVTSTNENLDISGFINPAQTKITLIVINNTNSSEDMELEVGGKTISAISAQQSKEGEFFKTLTGTTATGSIKFPSKTITTVVLDL